MENVVHANCNGGDAGGTIVGIEHLVASTVSNNRTIKCPDLQKEIQAKTGIKVSMRTVNRARGNVLNNTTEKIKTAYHTCPAYMDELVAESPGSVASVEVSNCDRS